MWKFLQRCWYMSELIINGIYRKADRIEILPKYSEVFWHHNDDRDVTWDPEYAYKILSKCDEMPMTVEYPADYVVNRGTLNRMKWDVKFPELKGRMHDEYASGDSKG